MFNIDFTKPWLYKDIIYFNQGNLSTNNTLRCKLVTGGSDDFTGGSIACTFTTKDSVEISGFGRLVDAKSGIVDIVFPSNALVVGTNKLEVLVNRADGGVAQSPPVMYDIWQGLTTGSGVEAESNYPILVELINTTNQALLKANKCIEDTKAVIVEANEAIDNTYMSANHADIATTKAYIAIDDIEATKTNVQEVADAKMLEVDKTIENVNTAIASGTKDLEVKESRRDMDGVEHDTLKLRLESDLKKGKVIEETKEGTYLSFNDTVKAPINSIELHGNTVQNLTNLADIKSTGIDNMDGTFTYTVVACGNNLCNNKFKFGELNDSDGGEVSYNGNTISSEFSVVNGGSTVIVTSYDNTSTYARMFEYDKNEKVITSYSISALGSTSKTLNLNTKYVKLKYQGQQANIKVQIEYGTVSTSYEEYQETRCDIKLPMQLKGVKGGKDILYYDELESAWCILRKIAYLNYSELENVGIASTLANCIQIHGTSSKEIKSYDSTGSSLITSKPFKHSFDDDEHMWIDSNTWKYKGSIPKSIASTLDEVKAYLAKGDLFMYFWDKNPEKIVLPRSEQIKLNSFANKTHIYTVSGEVDATVKATVSKSLACTVQANSNEINNLSNRVADIEGLKESQDFEYETDKGYLVCKDTKSGVVKDLKVYGKSVVNIPLDYSKMYPQYEYNKSTKTLTNKTGKDSTTFIDVPVLFENLEVGETYTLIYNAPSVGTRVQIGTEYNTNSQLNIITTIANTYIVKTFKAIDKCFKLKMFDVASVESRNVDHIMLLKGDYTQNPPSYFEGIASVGNGNEIEVLSVNKNLFIGNVSLSGNSNESILIDKFIIKETGNYFISFNTPTLYKGNSIYLKSVNKSYSRIIGNVSNNDGITKGLIDINNGDLNVILTSNDARIEIYRSNGDVVLPTNVMLNKGNYYIPYVVPKVDKKTILFKDTDNTWKPILNLRGIDENNRDVVDSVNNKFYESITEIIFNGDSSENWSLQKTENGKSQFTMSAKRSGIKPNSKILSDNYNNITSSQFANMDVGIFNGSAWGIVVNDPSITDVQSLKTKLQSNNVKINVQFLESKQYEVNPLDLESFENETMILFGSGVIAPHASWKITSSLPNFVKELSNQIKQLQEQVYKTNVANFAVALNTLDTKLRLDRLEAPQM